jgi:hypothetical protein
VKEQGTALPPLRIAGELQAVHGEIGVALGFDFAGGQRGEGGASLLDDVSVGTRDRFEFGRGIDWKNDGIIKATGAL